MNEPTTEAGRWLVDRWLDAMLGTRPHMSRLDFEAAVVGVELEAAAHGGYGIVSGDDGWDELPRHICPKPVSLEVALRWRDRGITRSTRTDEEVAAWVEANNERLALHCIGHESGIPEEKVK